METDYVVVIDYSIYTNPAILFEILLYEDMSVKYYE